MFDTEDRRQFRADRERWTTGTYDRRQGPIDRRKVQTNGSLRRRRMSYGRRAVDKSPYQDLPFKAYANAPEPTTPRGTVTIRDRRDGERRKGERRA